MGRVQVQVLESVLVQVLESALVLVLESVKVLVLVLVRVLVRACQAVRPMALGRLLVGLARPLVALA